MANVFLTIKIDSLFTSHKYTRILSDARTQLSSVSVRSSNPKGRRRKRIFHTRQRALAASCSLTFKRLRSPRKDSHASFLNPTEKVRRIFWSRSAVALTWFCVRANKIQESDPIKRRKSEFKSSPRVCCIRKILLRGKRECSGFRADRFESVLSQKSRLVGIIKLLPSSWDVVSSDICINLPPPTRSNQWAFPLNKLISSLSRLLSWCLRKWIYLFAVFLVPSELFFLLNYRKFLADLIRKHLKAISSESRGC